MMYTADMGIDYMGVSENRFSPQSIWQFFKQLATICELFFGTISSGNSEPQIRKVHLSRAKVELVFLQIVST